MEENNRNTHRHCILLVICRRGMKAVVSHSLCGLQEDGPCYGQNANLIEKSVVRIIGNGRGKEQEYSPSLLSLGHLQVESKCNGFLFALWTMDGWSMQWTEISI